MYKVLISGISGFIGGHLMKYLGSLGYEVDDISKKEFMNEDFSRLDDFQYRSRSTADNPKNVFEPKCKPDIVVHCAWPKIDLHSSDQLDYAVWTCNFYDECKKRGIRVINIGSSSEYGVKFEPMQEDMICEPINTYGIAKLMVTLYAKKLGFNTLRLFTIVGEGGHSFANIFENAKKWASPSDKRDFYSVRLVCKCIERLMYAEHLFGEIINCGSGKEINYIELVKNEYSKTKRVYMPNEDKRWFTSAQNQYEAKHWVADTTKMKELLNI